MLNLNWDFAGVADQLQTNYASDLRHILKTVFDCASTPSLDEQADDVVKLCEDDVEMSDSTDSEDEFVVEEGNQNSHVNNTDDTGRFGTTAYYLTVVKLNCVSYTYKSIIKYIMLKVQFTHLSFWAVTHIQ